MDENTCCENSGLTCDCQSQKETKNPDVKSKICECSTCKCSDDNEKTEIYRTDSAVTLKNKLDHIKARLGVNRSGHKIKPGLYILGNPDSASKVFLTANYSLSFDALRKSLSGFDAWILVLETYGINVWCAAGKGTFGTEELINRINITNLSKIVTHKNLILPRLGAPGVNANEVYKSTGFHVIWGTIRSSDIPEFIKTGVATPEMKRVRFPLKDRVVLSPVEIKTFLPYVLIPAVIFLLIGMWQISAKLFLTLITGTILFPALLFILPYRDFTIKGLILGYIVIIPVLVWELSHSSGPDISSFFSLASDLLIWPAVIAFLALNFTGCTTFASRSGVKTEIKKYTRMIFAMFISGIILAVFAGISGMVI